ncbi:MAG: FG-GAP-like repeat-containing protein [Bacteroidota bacterium]
MKIKKLHLVLFAVTFSFQILTFKSQAQVCFAPATNFQIGSNPNSGLSADFNGDGHADLATVHSNDSTVAIYLGDGSGNFGSATNFSADMFTNSITSADFNGDTYVDLATANYFSNTISVLLGNGAGAFGSATNFNLEGAYSIISADFNGDNNPDLAITQNDSSKIVILIGNGAGNFGAATSFAVAGRPSSLISADFNGDNKADLATANGYNNNVSILLGDGLGSFGVSTNVSVGTSPLSVTNADFNTDGNVDLAIANWDSDNVSILLGNGLGSFGTAINFNLDSMPRSIISADFNGDGKADLASANEGPNNVSVLLGDGLGSFGSASYFNTGYGTYSLINADFNEDLKIDLIAVNKYSNNISILLNSLPPALVITSPAAVCFPNTINITGGAVTAGSTGGGTLSYWTNVGATSPLLLPNAVTLGTYYIKATKIGGCTDLKPVIATVNPKPISNAGIDLTICSGSTDSIGIEGVAGNTYSWNSSIGISDSTVSAPDITTINTTSTPIVTTYTLIATTTLTGCQSTDNIIVTVNPQPVLVITNPAAVCFPGTVDVKAGAVTAGSTGGGTLSYWTNPAATDSLSSPSTVGTSGTNYIMVSAIGGCKDTNAINITVNPQPTATFTTVDESSSLYCDGSIVADLTGGTGTIQPEWLDNAQTVLAAIDSIGALCAGDYTLNLIDANLCTNTYTQAVLAGPLPPSPPICLITVDITNTHNIVVWEKTNLDMTSIDSFVVYREVTTNNYQSIGTVSKDSLSTFDDFAANPATTGYRYKLKSKNTHGVLSLFCDYHNTIYLNNNGANFNWTPYQVQNNTTPVSTYNVYRDDNSTGNFILIGNTTGNQFGYTDIQFASFPDASYYVEAVMVAGACQPTRTDFTASRSNVKHFGTAGVQELNALTEVNIYPNPAGNTLNITGITGKTTLLLYDVVGKLVLEKEVENNTILNTSHLVDGIYTLLTESKMGRSFNKVVISR